jgi:general secretion pathway protein L
MMIALLTLTFLSGIVWGGSHILKQRLTVKELDAEMNRLKSEIINIDRMQENAKTLEERLDYLTKLRNERVPVPEILKEMTQIIPEKAWIRDFTFSKKGIEIDGYAEAASELIPVLESSPFFNDVVFLSTITKEQDGKEHFRIGMKIEGMKTEDNE